MSEKFCRVEVGFKSGKSISLSAREQDGKVVFIDDIKKSIEAAGGKGKTWLIDGSGVLIHVDEVEYIVKNQDLPECG